MRHITKLLMTGAILLSTTAAQAGMGEPLTKLLPNDGANGDLFGSAVAISGTTVIVGAHWDNDFGLDSGAAYLFDASTGLQLRKLLPDDGAAGDWFGFSVAIDGTLAVVGAIGDDDKGAQAGAAYVFDVTTGDQVSKLLAADGSAGDWLGQAVAISGTGVVVTAMQDDDGGPDCGSAYVFHALTGAIERKLVAPDAAAFDRFGVSVSLDGTTAIVGAYFDEHLYPGGYVTSGSAYVFDTVTGISAFKLVPDDGALGDGAWFGHSVAISGAMALVGANRDDELGASSGAAYLFDTTTGLQITKLLPIDGQAGAWFGFSVALDGDAAMVQALGDNATCDDAGSVYVFDTLTGFQAGHFFLPDCGDTAAVGNTSSVALSNGVAVVGFPADDDNGTHSGSAYLIDVTIGRVDGDANGDGVVDVDDLTQVILQWGTCPAAPALCPADLNGDGAVDVDDLVAVLLNWG